MQQPVLTQSLSSTQTGRFNSGPHTGCFFCFLPEVHRCLWGCGEKLRFLQSRAATSTSSPHLMCPIICALYLLFCRLRLNTMIQFLSNILGNVSVSLSQNKCFHLFIFWALWYDGNTTAEVHIWALRHPQHGPGPDVWLAVIVSQTLYTCIHVLSHPGRGNSECCIVGYWKCFSNWNMSSSLWYST